MAGLNPGPAATLFDRINARLRDTDGFEPFGPVPRWEVIRTMMLCERGDRVARAQYFLDQRWAA